MSHDYTVRCDRCGETCSSEWNHAQADLIRAVEESHPLWLLRQTGWGQDVWNLGFRGQTFNGLAPFILEHFGCGSFLVVSEYWSKGDAEREAKYPPVRVEPKACEYKAICLERATREALAAADHLALMLLNSPA